MARILQGLAVWGCVPGTAGHEAGLTYGDILLSVNGMRTSNIEQYLAARSVRTDGARVLVFRNGVELCIDLEFSR